MNQYRSNGLSVQTEIEEIFPPENTRLYTKYTERYMADITLFCYVLGSPINSAIPIDLGDLNRVDNVDVCLKKLNFGHLKKLIWPNNNKANELRLWKFETPLREDNEVLKGLNENSHELGSELSPGTKFLTEFPTDYMFLDNYIHIIAQPPSSTTTGQGLIDISRCIAEHGYLPRQGGLGGTLLPPDPTTKSSNEGVKLGGRGRDFVSLRFDLVKRLLIDLKDRKVILVRAPPFSGKTSTAQILEETLINAPEYSKYRVIRISLIWESNVNWDTFGEKWKSIVGISWDEWTKQCRVIPSILIVDEAHLIYTNDKEFSNEEKDIEVSNKESANQFWATVKSLLQEISYINIIMFAAYGYRSSNYTGLATPVKLPEKNCKSLIDINFSQGELKPYVENYCNECFKSLDQQEILNLYEYILKVTEGHAGLIRHILVSITNALKKYIDTDELSWKMIFKYLNSKDFDNSIYSGCRAVPNVESLNKNQLYLCEETYLKGKTSFSTNKDAVYLIRTGVLVVVEDNAYLTFAAPLLKRSFFQQNYGIENSIETTPNDLHHFIVKIFTAMCNKLSAKILRETLGFGHDGRILEQTWQKEFYRIGTQVLGGDHFLSTEVGSVFGCEGKIDFYVDKLDWAIELLRDGEDMEEHKIRFEPLGGEYKEIVKYAKEIAIIDVRSIGIIDTRKEAKKVREMKKDFIYVSCSKDFDEFKIESLGKKPVTISFQN